MSSLPELSFTLSIGEVITLLVMVALIMIVIAIDRTRATATAQFYNAQLIPVTRDCPARLGFLQRLPRGGTIPEECYVCSQLIECLGFQRNPRT